MKISTSVNIFQKEFDSCWTFRISRFRSIFSKKFHFRFKTLNTLVSVNISENIFISGENFENLDSGQHVRKNFNFDWPRFQFQGNILKTSIPVNTFEKISISIQNFENLVFGLHFRTKFDFWFKISIISISVNIFEKFPFGSKFRISRFRSTFSKKIRFRFKV